MVIYDLLEPIRSRITAGTMAAWGTCAGMILLSKDAGRHDQPLIKVMDTCIERNAFGSQVDSFEAEVPIHGIDGGHFPAVFIRAPVVAAVGSNVEVLAGSPPTSALSQSGRNQCLRLHFIPRSCRTAGCTNIFFRSVLWSDVRRLRFSESHIPDGSRRVLSCHFTAT